MMLFFKRNKILSKENKELPASTIIILTHNNAEALRGLLYHLTNSSLFKTENCHVVIIDNYSFDNTRKVGIEYQENYPNHISFFKKQPQHSHFETLATSHKHPHEFIEIIDLSKIQDKDKHLPPKTWVKMLNYTARILANQKNHIIDRTYLIERLEKDHQAIYHTLRNDLLEPLTNVQMLMKHENISKDSISAINKFIDKVNLVLDKYDPSLYSGEGLLESIKDVVENFTNRTQISCEVSESGVAARKVDYYLGMSVLKIINEALLVFEKNGPTSKIFIKLRWTVNKIVLHLIDHNTKVNKHALALDSLSFIEERITIIEGKYTFNTKNGMELSMVIPTL